MHSASAREIKVSVVIPVYNAAKYMRQCLDSVKNQTLQDIEIICVDDGSTDDSLRILEEYQQNDPRFTILSQENQYSGAARNKGKSQAKGKYLVFWDSDDYFALEALEKMYQKCEEDEADICVCAGRRFYEDVQLEVKVSDYLKKKYLPEICPFNRLDNEDYILNFTSESAWNKMFRRSFVENLELDFQQVRNGNDVYFVANALCLAKSITYVEDHLICYRKNRKDSLVGSMSKSPLTPIKAWIDVAENLKKADAFPERSFANKALSVIVYCLHNISEWDSYDELLSFLKNGGLEKLSIRIREKGFYYQPWHEELLEHLLNDSPQDFLAYFAHCTYYQHGNTMARKLALKQRVEDLKTENKRLRKTEKKLRAKIDKLRRSQTETRFPLNPYRFIQRARKRLAKK